MILKIKNLIVSKIDSDNLFNSLFITFGNILKMSLGILLIPIYSRYVSPAELGKFDYLLTFSPLISQFVSLGLTNSIARFYYMEPQKGYVGYIYSIIKKRSLVVGLLIFIFGLFLYVQISNFIGFYVFLLFIINFVLENHTFTSVYSYALQDKFKKRAIVQLISVLFRYLFTIILVILLDNKLLALALGMFTSWSFLFLQSRHDNKVFLNRDELSLSDKKELYKYSRPLLYLGVFSFIYQTSDRFFLGSLLKENAMEQLGYWGMAQRVVTILSMSLGGFLEVWNITLFKGDDINLLVKSMRNYMYLIFLSCIFLILVMFVFKSIVVNILFTKAYEASFLLAISLIGIFCWTNLREILEKSFLKEGKTRLVTTVFIIFSVLLLLGNLFAIPSFGIYGLVYVTILVKISHTLVLFFLNRHYDNKISFLPLSFALVTTFILLIYFLL